MSVEAECGGILNNTQVALVIKGKLEAIGHPQKPMRIKTNNSTANSFVHACMRIERSKTWDMCYHWLRECARKKIVTIFWEKVSNNDAD